MILLDCDGVLADFVGAIRRELRRERLPIEEDQIKHLDLSQSLSKEQMRVVRLIEKDPSFCYSIKPYPYARELIAALAGVDYAILTAPWTPPNWCDERLSWLEDKLGVPRDRVIFAAGPIKKLVRGNLLVEDSPANIESWQRNNTTGRTVLVRRPWNQPYDSVGWSSAPENLVATVKGLIG